MLRASGVGRTALSAFHAALVAVGLGQVNLVRLSSVIPPGTGVDATGRARAPESVWGDRLYCVYAERAATVVGEQAWAGVGWVRRLDGLGGLFVEHEGADEQSVSTAIQASLADMVAGAAEEYTPPEWVVQGAACAGQPVCALVIAPYEAAPWPRINNHSSPTGNRNTFGLIE
ncbi:pyruvoyl-dependent arginine decarboxylase [Rhizomonospora bruguierae]|uniref:pyruvoyl-dependent arginine decarboxylase n=1 Tax=Rhizomonospora bruguierae TaxID=1581705 RepID=UPI0020BDA3CF|nr:pyruvoyl-dependent arginine decarboxylase [Micromonospora sp. NBRC 107566]